MHHAKLALLAAGMSLALAGCNQGSVEKDAGSEKTAEANAGASADHKDPVASAMAAAPAAIAQDATIVQAQADGSMKTLREGKNGWTCMPDSPTTPGPDPMCMDENAGKWAAAWIGKKTPPDGTTGVIYMLEGGTDASNTDPYASAPTAENNWVETGPHIMIVGSKDILAGYPSGPKPDTSAPYVMWAGTPYAHLMVPVAKPST
ncbi:MAG TPA: hypothetical protein VFH89_01175 [Sphingomicrobium sp.]|nr:hypothetical protein [Sphingomicrobium sp.]